MLAEPRATASEQLGDWIAKLSFDDLPLDVVDAVKLHLLDAVGIGLAAFALGEMDSPSAMADELGGRPRATAIGLPVLLPETLAALVNASLIHALDFDDTHPRAVMHSSSVVAPTAIACAEAFGSTGSELVTAAVAGYEVSARVGLAGAESFLPRGFHPTGVCGVFGAAAIAAKLRRASAEAVTSTLGICGSLSAGLLECLSDGTRTKPLHAGFAAHGGIMAASLAAHGGEGPRGVLDGRLGLLSTYLGEAHDEEAVTAGIGEQWETLAIAFKAYPACHFTHTCVDAVAQLLDEFGLTAANLSEITCRVHGDQARTTVVEPSERKRVPKTPYEAKFSLPYCVAHRIVTGELTTNSFTNAALSNAEVVELAAKVRCCVVPFADGNEYSGSVELVLTDGRRAERTVLSPRGSNANPMRREDVVEKFYENARLALPQPDIDELIHRFANLENEEIGAIVRPLRTAQRSAASLA